MKTERLDGLVLASLGRHQTHVVDLLVLSVIVFTACFSSVLKIFEWICSTIDGVYELCNFKCEYFVHFKILNPWTLFTY